MSFQYKFEKILHVKEKEKDQALINYQEAIQKFENAAQQLFDLLKKKELFEEKQRNALVDGLIISEIRQNQLFNQNLEKSIEHIQMLVMNARNHMNWCEEKLKERNIEMKKYEKMKEKSYQIYLQSIKEIEQIQLNEIASLQYYRQAEVR